MTKELKIILSDEDMESIAGGAETTVKGYFHSETADFISEEDYAKKVEKGEDVSKYKETELRWGIVEDD